MPAAGCRLGGPLQRIAHGVERPGLFSLAQDYSHVYRSRSR